MSKKVEITPINPTEALRAIEGFKADAMMLVFVVHNALHFLEDSQLDKAKAAEAVTPELRKAYDQLRRWVDA